MHPKRGHFVPQPLCHLLATKRFPKARSEEQISDVPGVTDCKHVEVQGSPCARPSPRRPAGCRSPEGAEPTRPAGDGAEGRGQGAGRPCEESPLDREQATVVSAPRGRGRGARPLRPAGRQLLPPGGHPPTGGTQSLLGEIGARLPTPVSPRAARAASGWASGGGRPERPEAARIEPRREGVRRGRRRAGGGGSGSGDRAGGGGRGLAQRREQFNFKHKQLHERAPTAPERRPGIGARPVRAARAGRRRGRAGVRAGGRHRGGGRARAGAERRRHRHARQLGLPLPGPARSPGHPEPSHVAIQPAEGVQMRGPGVRQDERLPTLASPGEQRGQPSDPPLGRGLHNTGEGASGPRGGWGRGSGPLTCPQPARGLYNGEATGWGRRTPGKTASERRGVCAAWGPEGGGHFATWPCALSSAPSPRPPSGFGPAAFGLGRSCNSSHPPRRHRHPLWDPLRRPASSLTVAPSSDSFLGKMMKGGHQPGKGMAGGGVGFWKTLVRGVLKRSDVERVEEWLGTVSEAIALVRKSSARTLLHSSAPRKQASICRQLTFGPEGAWRTRWGREVQSIPPLRGGWRRGDVGGEPELLLHLPPPPSHPHVSLAGAPKAQSAMWWISPPI